MDFHIKRLYDCKDGRKRASVIFSDGSREFMQYAKYVWMKKNGPVPEGMTIDHIDRDKTNDDIGNLQLLTQVENSAKSVIRFRQVESPCLWCEKLVDISARKSRGRKKNSREAVGPFCSRSCSGKYGAWVRKTGGVLPTGYDKEKYRIDEASLKGIGIPI